jgi:aspartate ammonia-lyase
LSALLRFAVADKSQAVGLSKHSPITRTGIASRAIITVAAGSSILAPSLDPVVAEVGNKYCAVARHSNRYGIFELT